MDHTFPHLPVIFGAIAVLALAVFAILKQAAGKKRSSAGADKDYQARPAILTPAERSFAGVLASVLPAGVAFVTKVRLGDVFVTRKGLTPSRRASAWNRINQKHVDFLLVRTSDFAPLAGIELDDKSHDNEDRKERDRSVDGVFASGELPLLHVRAGVTYSVAELCSKIDLLLRTPSGPPKIG